MVKIDVVATARSLRPEITGAPKRLYITFEGGNARITFDGTVPTATLGHLVTDGGSVALFGDEINNFRVISLTTTTMQVTPDSQQRDNRYV